ncbi:MAG: hypothetical protein IKE36_05215 [Solobacterium sp.]|nr:hypothetical protein [Solobacterium sp.]
MSKVLKHILAVILALQTSLYGMSTFIHAEEPEEEPEYTAETILEEEEETHLEEEPEEEENVIEITQEEEPEESEEPEETVIQEEEPPVTEEPEETPEVTEPEPEQPVIITGQDIRGIGDGWINGVPRAHVGYVYVSGIRWKIIGGNEWEWLLLSYSTLGGPKNWQNAYNYCNTVYEGFSPLEKIAVVPTTKADNDEVSVLNNATLFLLSLEEVQYYLPNYSDRVTGPDKDDNDQRRSWWTRAYAYIPYGQNNDGRYFIYSDGAEGYTYPYMGTSTASRPAFQFDYRGVLFKFAAEGPKAQEPEGNSDFGKIISTSENGFRLTMKDTLSNSPRRDFQAHINLTDSIRVAPGESLTVSYQGAAEGDAISALICQGENNLYYATTEQNAYGKWTMTIPESIHSGNYTIKVFCEQQNGDYQTDYASPVSEISLEVPSQWELLQDEINEGGLITLERDYIAEEEDTALVIPAETEVTLNLNGHTLDRGLDTEEADGNIITNHGTLTITGSGTLTGAYNTGSGGAIYNDGYLAIHGGNYTGNRAKEAGAVHNVPDAVLVVTGGNFSDNNVITFGGGAFVNYGTMYMEGGTISGNYVPGNGGGIWTRGTLTVTGGTITGNTAEGYGGGINWNGGTVAMAGAPVITDNYSGSELSDVYIPSGKRIEISGPLDSDARIGIRHAATPTVWSTVVFTTGLDGNGTEKSFFSDIDSISVSRDLRGEAALVPYASITMEQDYLALKTGETGVQIVVATEPEDWAENLQWRIEDADGNVSTLITVDGEGNVTAGSEPGTAWAVAQVVQNGVVLAEARCRIDVVKGEGEVFEEGTFSGLRLLDTKATIELYKTAYTRIKILPEFEQNNVTFNNSGPNHEDTGATLIEAKFEDIALNRIFYLHIIDDRTLEIIPTWEALAGKVEVKSSYTSEVRVYVNGQWTLTSNKITLTIKKNMPKIKAKAITLNSYAPGMDVQQIKFTGGTVLAGNAFPDPDKSNPGWLGFDRDSGTVTYTGEAGKTQKKTTLYLKVEPEGWVGTVSVPVTISVKNTAPKITFKTKTLTVKPGTSDMASTKYTIKPAVYEDAEVKFSRITEGSAAYENGTVLNVSVENGEVIVVPAAADGSAHTYTVYLSVYGKESSFKVKTLASSTRPVLNLTAKGTIDLAVYKSPVTITAKMKNINTNQVSFTVVDIINKDDPETNLISKFYILQQENVITITAGSISEAGTYYATVLADCGDSFVVKTVKFSVKQSAAVPKVSVTLKASGSIDVVRPLSNVTLKPTIKNCYEYTLNPFDITMTKTYDGKTKKKVSEDVTGYFYITVVDGKYVIRPLSPGMISHADKFTVKATVEGVTSKAVTLKVVQGKASVKLSTKEVTLLKTDRYSRAQVDVVLSEAQLGVARVVMVSPKDKSGRPYFTLAEQNGTYEICYNENVLPKDIAKLKTKTVKLKVYLEGNTTAKPNATLSVKVKFK